MALDEATTKFLEQMAEAGQPPLHEMKPAEARGLTAMLKEMYGEGPPVARAERREIPAEGRSIPIQILVPSERPRGVIVYYHGGGWVIGAIDEFEALGRKLATRTGCAVVLVDYRLAPEHPYPAAADDAWDALLWIDEHLEEIAGARVPLIVAGDSAGGNLAAIVSQKAHRNGRPAISLQVLVYPVTDCDLDNASYTDPENQLMLRRETMIWFWDHYAPTELRKNPDASPARAGDLTGLPPAVVLTAEHDVLRDEGEAYADALAKAGVPVSHRRFDGQMHGFFTMVNLLPGSDAGIAFVADEIDKHLTSIDTSIGT
jgi:acetyl esterase